VNCSRLKFHAPGVYRTWRDKGQLLTIGMKKQFILLFASAGLLAGCVNLSSSPPLGDEHPANPNANVSSSEPVKPFLMTATNLSALRLEDLPKPVDASEHDHGAHAKQEPTPATQAKEATPAQGAVYTCPHHPEVTTNRPGECPKCGMKLEVKK
jgi:hypothetical protein